MQVVPACVPHRFKAVSCAVLGSDTVQAGKEIVKGQRLDELQAYGLGSLDHKTPRQGIAAIQLGRVGIVPGGESAVRAAARVGGDTAGLDGDGRFGVHALRLGDVEGHRLLCQLGQLDGLVHIGGRNTDRAGGRLIAKLADGVGVVGILGSDILVLTAILAVIRCRAAVFRQFYRGIRRGHGKGNDRQFDHCDIDLLIRSSRGHLTVGILIALFGDGVGIFRPGFHGEHALLAGHAGHGLAVRILERNRGTFLIRRNGQLIKRRHGEVLELHRILGASIRIRMLKGQRYGVAHRHVHRAFLPCGAVVGGKNGRAPLLHSKAVITV